MALYLRGGDREQATSVAYLYKWTEKTTGKWYIGSRTAAGCHPNDGHICSSKVVKPLIESDPGNWYREVLVTGAPEYIAELEAAYLVTLNAKSDEMSYNQHNGDGKFTPVGYVWTDEQRKAASITRTGIKKTSGHVDRIAASLRGLNKTPAHREAIGLAQTVGYYISSTGDKYTSTRTAAAAAGVSQTTMRNWIKTNKKGWHFCPKGD